ncbi:MAG: class I SAM-dependent methyltransferase [Thiolinea sp.]
MGIEKNTTKSAAGESTGISACERETSRWYRSAPGQNAARGVQSEVEGMTGDVFGYYALQLGAMAQQYTLLQESRISNCFTVAPLTTVSADVDLIADPAALPVEFDNVDLVVASHVLDCAASPSQVLREIERVLVPEGHCILIDYNPFSWRGIGLFWKRLRKQDVPVTYTSFRLRDWFTVLGFEVLEIRTTGFRTRADNKLIFRRIRFLNKVFDRYCQLFGNVRLIHVRKKVSKRIMMKPRLRTKTKPLLKPGMAVNGSSVGKTINKAAHQTMHQLEQRESGE